MAVKPRLLVVAGPMEGTSFVLSEEEATVGRDLTAQICLADLSVSRRHCLIRKEAQAFRLEDLGSLNQTSVNGLPVKDHDLKSGDRIRLGNSQLIFLLDEEAALPAASLVGFTERRIITKQTLAVPPGDGTDPVGPGRGAVPAASRSTRDLHMLLKISGATNSIRQLEAFERHLLESTFEVIPAERGVILLRDGKTGETSSLFGLHAGHDQAEPIKVSRTVTERVFGEGVALLSNNVFDEVGLRTASSLMAPGVKALLAAPMLAAEKAVGLIYLDTSDPHVNFDEHHLQLLRAVASLATVTLENIRLVTRLESENRRLQAEISIEHDMVGDSPRMREVYQFIPKAARADSTVLIRGESGTGKELAARAIHLNSARAAQPFVAINCAALTETLLESELFGHEKGAFTGAVATKKGKLEIANGGTLFLDELGEMPASLQSKLLRVLQNHEFERVGGNRPIRVDIRLVAATNRNLEQAIKEGRFREDLYYRLNVLCLTMPPLRERRGDILLLANYFATRYSQKCKRPFTEISPEAYACLMNYYWPGNVRELENAVERAIVLGATDRILVEDLPEAIIETRAPLASPAAAQNFYEAVNTAKRGLIFDAVRQARGNYTEAARLLGMHPNHLHRLIRNLDIRGELQKEGF